MELSEAVRQSDSMFTRQPSDYKQNFQADFLVITRLCENFVVFFLFEINILKISLLFE